MNRKRKIPLLEIFVILFTILLLQGEFGLTKERNYSFFDYLTNKDESKDIPLITSLAELRQIKPHEGATIKIDTSIVSAYQSDGGYRLIGLADIGERVKTTISLFTNDIKQFKALSSITNNARLTIAVETISINNVIYNLAAFEDELVPIESTEVEIMGELLTFQSISNI